MNERKKPEMEETELSELGVVELEPRMEMALIPVLEAMDINFICSNDNCGCPRTEFPPPPRTFI